MHSIWKFLIFSLLLKIAAVYSDTCYMQWESHSYGYFYSPHYPYPYPSNLNCEYHFPKRGSYEDLTLGFSNFDLKSTTGFYGSQDRLEINGHMYTEKDLEYGRVTMKLPAVITFVTNRQKSVPHKGFSANAEYVKTACKILWASKSTGHFSSPGYRYHYPKYSEDCKYTFPKRDLYRQVTITFSDFGLRNSSTCYYASLEILGRKYCSTQLNSATVVMELPAVLVFNTAILKSYTGFNATFEYVTNACSLQWTGDRTGTFSSPGYPYNYPGNFSCTFEFPTKKRYEAVRILFSEFDLGHGESVHQCSKVYLAINGNKHCSKELEEVTMTVFTPTSIVFKTGSLDKHKGFRASFEYVFN